MNLRYLMLCVDRVGFCIDEVDEIASQEWHYIEIFASQEPENRSRARRVICT